MAQAEAQVAAQRRVVERLRHGSRPDEMAQARANLESAKVGAVNARRPYERLKSLVDCSVRGAVSPLAAAAPAARHPARCLSVPYGADLLSPATGALARLGVGPPAQQLRKQQSHCAVGNTGWGAVYSFATLHAFWWLCPNTGTQPPLTKKVLDIPKSLPHRVADLLQGSALLRRCPLAHFPGGWLVLLSGASLGDSLGGGGTFLLESLQPDVKRH